MPLPQDMPTYFRYMTALSASDLFFSAGAPATFKIDGLASPLEAPPMTAQQIQALAYTLLNREEIERFERDLELNKAVDINGVGRFRLNLYRQRGLPALVARHIRADIPTLAELGLPGLLEGLVLEERGLVLLTGAAGSGKSTTLAAMIHHRNRTRSGHILTVEDPIEFLHSHRQSIVDQREVGLDTLSFGNALRNAMREAPDVIVIGEIRDLETIKHALSYAETGHLCLATLHASNAHQALQRIINFFDENYRAQILLDLSMHLKAIVSQRLVRNTDGRRIPAVEVMHNSGFVNELILNGRIDEIGTAISRHTENGSCSFDQSLFALYRQGAISKDEALTHADSRANLSVLMRLHEQPRHSRLGDIDMDLQ